MSEGFKSNLVWTMVGIPLCLCTLLYSLFGRKKMVLQGKVVLITGASGGLGEALAEVFYEAGCKVIISGRQSKSLERVRDRLSNKMKPKCHVPAILVMNLTDKVDVPEKMKTALTIFGHIDILINNAGMGFRGLVHETDVDVYEKVMKVNYLGPIYVTKALLPHMMERESGHIVVIGSMQGKLSIPARVPYSAAKHAVEGFFDSFRAELSLYNIGVTTISPTYIHTNFSINATTGDGSTYNMMDKKTETGLDPLYVARKVLKSVVYRKEEIIIAPLHHQFAVCLRIMAPWLLFKIMARRAKREALEASRLGPLAPKKA